MAQVLVNVLDNALKYSPPEGIIQISVRVQDNELAIEVADQGPGIPKEHLARIFTKFFRVSEEVSGTGLGLTISKGIVEAHGGRIWAENRPEGGAKIILTLPLSPSPEEEPQGPKEPT